MSDFVSVPRYNNNHNNYRGGRGRFHHGRGGGRGRGGRGRGGRGRGRGGGRGHRGGGRGRGNFVARPEQEIFQEFGTPSSTSISIAIEGCCHGELETIYARLKNHTHPVELLICCGDFQSLRTFTDFHSYAAPPKYHQLGTFYKYYSGELTAPILTIFVGGNHENSQQLQELYYGGWVAPNIYYLGAAGVVRYKGLRIGGVSGIYKSHDYHKGHYELPPFDRNTLRSIYHVRKLEVQRMKCLVATSNDDAVLDVMISHDWPQGIEQHGNTRELIRRKPYFLNEINTNSLGSPANREMLESLKPRHWFAAHLHVGFQATMKHGKEQETNKESSSSVTDLVPSQAVQKKTEELKKQEDDSNKQDNDSSEDPMQFCQPVSNEPVVPSTKFISLDKCLPGKAYLAIAHLEPNTTITTPANDQLCYDPEWLAILRKTHEYTDPNANLPTTFPTITQEDIDWAQAKAGPIPLNFVRTVPPPSGPPPRGLPHPPFPRMGNPQTDEFLQRMELNHIITIPYNPNDVVLPPSDVPVQDDYEIDLDDAEDDAVVAAAQADENEIDLDDEEEEGDSGDVCQDASAVATKKPRLEENGN